MPCSRCGDPTHNIRSCPHVATAEENEKKRSADAASLGAGPVQATRPRLSGEVPAGQASAQAPVRPLKVFDYVESSPASSPYRGGNKASDSMGGPHVV